MVYSTREGKILSNRILKEDLFEGKSHEKLAKAIAKEIQNNQDCYIIGLDGEWGSGKSNLVGIIEKYLSNEVRKSEEFEKESKSQGDSLEENQQIQTNEKGQKDKQSKEGDKNEIDGCCEKYYFYTYDAWRHQTDSQRRAILMELVLDITKERNGSEPLISENKLKESPHDLLATKRITKTSIIPSIGKGAIIVVLVSFLLSTLANIASLCEWVILKSIIFIVLCLIFIVVIYLIKRKAEKKEENSFSRFIYGLFLADANQIKEGTTIETVLEEEPDSQKFRDWFSAINKALDKKILILVFDNMDRLPKEKVSELWAAILSFFSDEEFSNIRIIVPFDRMHLRSAFQSEDIGGQQCDKQCIYADEFINKTFSIVYTVPPPIMKDWMLFFKNKWKEAFGCKAKVDNSILQIYDALVKEHSPRKIIAFINEFVTIKNNCDSKINDEYIALYILGKSEIQKKPLEEILEPSYLGSLDFLYGKDSEMPKSISSLYYQLPLENALDTIYISSLAKELDSQKIDLLEKLKNNETLWLILRNAIKKINNIENATLALEKSIGSDVTSINKGMWDELYQRSIELNNQNNSYKEFHLILISHINNNERKNYFEFLLKQYHQHIDENFDVVNYVDGVDKLLILLGECNDDAIKKYKSKIIPRIFRALLKTRKEKWVQYGLYTNFEEFDEYFSNLSDEEIANESIYPYIKQYLKTTKYVEKVKSLLKSKYNAISLVTIRGLINRIKEIEKRPFDVKAIWDSPKILHVANKIDECKELLPDILAMIIASYWNIGNQSISTFFSKRALPSNNKLVESVAGVVEYYIDYGELLIRSSRYKYQFISNVAIYLLDHTPFKSNIKVKEVLQSYEKIIATLNVRPEKLLKRIDDGGIKGIIIDDIKNFPIRLFTDMQKVDTELSKHCLRLAKNLLEQTSQDEWHKIFITALEDFIFKLLKAYHPSQLPSCYDAFKKLMIDYASGKIMTTIAASRANELVTILEEMGMCIDAIFMEIRDVFINKSNINLAKLKYFGKWLLTYGQLENDSKSLEKIVKPEFLGDNEVQKILLENINALKNILNKADSTDSFYKKLKDLYAVPQNRSRKNLISLCDELEIKNATPKKVSKA